MSDAPTAPMQALEQVAKGLLFPSETDVPLVAFFWSAEDIALTPQRLAQLAGVPAGTAIKTVKLDNFFRPATKEEDWHNAQEQAEARRFQELVRVIKSNLADVKVFRVGETSIDVFVVGRVEGGFAGLRTRVVET